jgi:hypothetical protein
MQGLIRSGHSSPHPWTPRPGHCRIQQHVATLPPSVRHVVVVAGVPVVYPTVPVVQSALTYMGGACLAAAVGLERADLAQHGQKAISSYCLQGRGRPAC